MSEWGSLGRRKCCPRHSCTSLPSLCGSFPVSDGLMWHQQQSWDVIFPFVPGQEVPAEIKGGRECTRWWCGVARGTAARRRGKKVCLNQRNNHYQSGAILRLGLLVLLYFILFFYKKKRSFSDEKVVLLYCNLTSTRTVSRCFISDPLSSSSFVSFKSSFSSQPQPVPCLNCFNLQVFLILILNSKAANQLLSLCSSRGQRD